jgi:hypothetical protein
MECSKTGSNSARAASVRPLAGPERREIGGGSRAAAQIGTLGLDSETEEAYI